MRRLLSVLLALGFVVAVPAAASAHDVLERTNPADGTSVDRLPGAVELTFSEEPVAIGTQVLVKGPSGNVESGSPSIDGRVVTQPLDLDAPGGDYTVTYRVTSDDGHPVTGTFTFHAVVGLDGSTATAGPSVHVKPAGAAEQEATASSPFVPVLLTVVGTLVLLGIGGFVVLRGRRPGTRS
jgi:methionine-rich copper-binding protein CopC